MASRSRPRQTFASFIESEDTQFALAAARCVAKTPGWGFNPLIIHSGSRGDRTHLLRAVAAALRARRPRLGSVIVTSGNAFVRAYLAARARGATGAFRARYRASGALLVDDVERILTSAWAARAFASVVTEFHRRNSQILLTSALPPESLGPIQTAARLLEWSMAVRIGRGPVRAPRTRF